jgi:hypothetical protein
MLLFWSATNGAKKLIDSFQFLQRGKRKIIKAVEIYMPIFAKRKV